MAYKTRRSLTEINTTPIVVPRRYKLRAIWLLTAFLWIGVTVLVSIMIPFVISDPWNLTNYWNHIFFWSVWSLVIYYSSIAVVGLIRLWGWLIPSTLISVWLGIFFVILPPKVNERRSDGQSVVEDFLPVFLYVFVGLVIGFLLDRNDSMIKKKTIHDHDENVNEGD